MLQDKVTIHLVAVSRAVLDLGFGTETAPIFRVQNEFTRFLSWCPA